MRDLHFLFSLVDSPDVNAISNITGTQTNGFITVSFARKLNTGASTTNDVVLSNCAKFYTLFAMCSGQFNKHPGFGPTSPLYVYFARIPVHGQA